MDSLQINQTTDLVTLVGGELRKMGAYHVGPCPFCGGRDRFTIKHTHEGDLWYCRQCGDGKYHTVIDFIMRRDNVDFKTAYKTLTGETPESEYKVVIPRAKLMFKPINLPLAKWQAKALKKMDRASDRLLELDENHIGCIYLKQRCLSRSVWEAWHLGFSIVWDLKAKRNRPAIVIPWLDMDAQTEVITAIKYRFIDNDPNGLRYVSLAGSVPLLFGLWDVIDSDTILLLIEGEINALSIWQCRLHGVSVVSFGSESGSRVDILRALALRYRKVFVWADDPKKAGELRTVLGPAVTALQSPVQDGVKWDANRILQEGFLPAFISKILGVPSS